MEAETRDLEELWYNCLNRAAIKSEDGPLFSWRRLELAQRLYREECSPDELKATGPNITRGLHPLRYHVDSKSRLE